MSNGVVYAPAMEMVTNNAQANNCQTKLYRDGWTLNG